MGSAAAWPLLRVFMKRPLQLLLLDLGLEDRPFSYLLRSMNKMRLLYNIIDFHSIFGISGRSRFAQCRRAAEGDGTSRDCPSLPHFRILSF